MKDTRLLFDGKYEVLAKIREGGMGAVYEVRHRLLHEKRVIKVMRPGAGAGPDLERRFLDEAKIAIRLKHPNLCAIHDFAVDETGTAYLVMEHVDGVSLADFVASRGLPGVPLTLEIAHQALLALSYLHRKGIVHRDVAPDNLMLTYDDDHHPLVKLIDLGIARVVDRDADLTAEGLFVGKPRYASPEQLGALPPGETLDGRSDLYSLGIVLYELLTSRLPFRGKSPAELLQQQQLNRVLPFEESDPQGRIPPDLRAVVLQALERKREDRFATADEFDQAIAGLRAQYGSREKLEITPEMVRAIRGPGEPVASDAPGFPFRTAGRRDAPGGPRRPIVSGVDPDPLHTVMLPVERAPAPPTPSLAAAAPPGNAPTPAGRSPEPAAPPRPASRPPAPPRSVDEMRPSERTGARGLDMGVPLRRRPSRRGLPFREAGVFALAALAVLAVWWSWPSRTSSRDTRREANAPQPAASPAVVQVAPPPSDAPAVTASVGEAAPAPANVLSPEAEAPAPSAAASPAPEPAASPAPEAPALSADAAPTPAPTSAPAESAAGSTPSPATDLAAAVERTTSARRDADEARAREFAPTTYARAVAKQASAQGLAARKSTVQAAAAYRDAAALFARAAEAARQTHPSAPRAPRSRASVEPAPGPPPELLPADSKAAEPAPGSAPSEKAAPEPAAAEPQQETARAEEPAAAGASAEAHRQIVQAIGDYAWARRHHDPQLLARVFPSDGARLAQEPPDLRTAGLTVEVQAIDFESETRASATVQERLTPAEPRTAGTPEWATIVLDLERRGGRWVIVSRRRL